MLLELENEEHEGNFEEHASLKDGSSEYGGIILDTTQTTLAIVRSMSFSARAND